MEKSSKRCRPTSVALVVGAISSLAVGIAHAQTAPVGMPVPPPPLVGHTWQITPGSNGNLQPQIVIYEAGGAAFIYHPKSAKPSQPNAVWFEHRSQNYLVMFETEASGMRAYRSAWAENGKALMPMMGYSCMLKAPSHSANFDCQDNGTNYLQSRERE